MSISRLLIGGAVLSLSVGGMAAFKHSNSSPASAQAFSPAPTPSTSPQIAASPTATPQTVVPSPNYQGYQAHRITTCAGQPSNANFRQSPSLSPSTVLGAVSSGETIYLTGRTTYSDGVNWHEAIAPSLFPVPDAGAINNTQPGRLDRKLFCEWLTKNSG